MPTRSTLGYYFITFCSALLAATPRPAGHCLAFSCQFPIVPDRCFRGKITNRVGRMAKEVPSDGALARAFIGSTWRRQFFASCRAKLVSCQWWDVCLRRWQHPREMEGEQITAFTLQHRKLFVKLLALNRLKVPKQAETRSCFSLLPQRHQLTSANRLFPPS